MLASQTVAVVSHGATDPPGWGTLWVPDHEGESYLAVLRRLHAFLNPATYLEIGCGKGTSLALARCLSLAIDPRSQISVAAAIGTKPLLAYYRMTSDAFFRAHSPTATLGGPIDMAFLDGMHLCEFLLRDFINVERHSRRNSVIVLHDCLPVEWPMAERKHIRAPIHDHRKNAWTGDVWRTALLLKQRRPDLEITAYAARPTGLVCITNLSPTSTTLADAYAECVREMMSQSLQEFGIDNLFRALNVESTTVLQDKESVWARFWL